ncbi:MAG: hypothetical protein AAGC81_19150 [Pseudomonadota bacterium]
MRAWLFSIAALLGSAGLALAEVCDKERPSWNRSSDGPVSMWIEPVFFFSNWLALAMLVMIMFALASGRRWLLITAAFACIGMISVLVLEWTDGFEIHLASIREGCVGEPHLVIAIFSVLLAASVFRLGTSRRQQSE